MDLPALLEFLSRGSIAVVLGVMLWLGMTRRVVTRGELEECHRERDRLIAEAEQRLREVNEDRLRIIADRDRLRKIVEDRRKLT